MPDYMLDSVFDITPDFLKCLDIRAVIFDIDNTLVPHNHPDPDVKIVDYLEKLKNNGIKIGIVSNNSQKRVSLFTKNLGVSYSYKSGKPKKGSLDAVSGSFMLEPSHIALVGDQIFTDILAAKREGIISILVSPIDISKENLFIRLKRFFERPLISACRKKMSLKSKI